MFEGKRYYCYGQTQKEAERKAVRKQALLEANVKEYKSTITVEKWAERWIEDYKEETVGEAWLKQMKGIVRNYIIPSIGGLQLRAVRPADIARMYNSNAQLSASHTKKIAQITRQIFDSAEANDIIDKSPARHVKPPSGTEKIGYRTITDEERMLTIRTADKYPEDGLFFLIMLYCGLRPQEVARLTMYDIDREKRTCHVRSARKADGSTGKPKSKAGTRDVPIPDALMLRIDALNKKPDELIVTSAQGRLLTRTSQKRMWMRFKRKMDIENGAKLFRGGVVESTLADDLSPYCYRHTYCTDLQDAGVPVTVAKELMGHSDIKMTADIYTHHSPRAFEDAREKINRHADIFDR